MLAMAGTGYGPHWDSCDRPADSSDRVRRASSLAPTTFENPPERNAGLASAFKVTEHTVGSTIPDNAEVGTDDMVTAYLFDQNHGEKVDFRGRTRSAPSRMVTAFFGSMRIINLPLALKRDPRDPPDHRRPGTPQKEVRKPGSSKTTDICTLTAIAVSDAESDLERETVVIECVKVGAKLDRYGSRRRHRCARRFPHHRRGRRRDRPPGCTVVSRGAPRMGRGQLAYGRSMRSRRSSKTSMSMPSPNRANDPEQQIGTLVAARRRVGHLRRTLAPHREIFAALSHSEFDPLSSEGSSACFAELAVTSRRGPQLCTGCERRHRKAPSTY